MRLNKGKSGNQNKSGIHLVNNLDNSLQKNGSIKELINSNSHQILNGSGMHGSTNNGSQDLGPIKNGFNQQNELQKVLVNKEHINNNSLTQKVIFCKELRTAL
jgi:hypothetical protein